MKQSNTPDLVFRAFSDPTRLRILCLLRTRELCVGDLVSILKKTPGVRVDVFACKINSN